MSRTLPPGIPDSDPLYLCIAISLQVQKVTPQNGQSEKKNEIPREAEQ